MNETQQPQPPVPPVAVPAPSGIAITALVLGLVALILGFIPVLSIVMGGVAIVLGVIALKRQQSKGMSIAGIVTGGIGALSSLIATGLLIFAVATLPTIEAPMPIVLEELEEEFGLEEIGEPQAEPLFDESTTHEDFQPIDAATLEDVLAHPDDYAGAQYLVYGNGAGPLVIDALDEQGHCAMEFLVSAEPGQGNVLDRRALGMGEGTLYDCDMFEYMVVTTEEEQAAFKRVYVGVVGQSGILSPNSGEELPGFAVFDVQQ